MKTHLSEMSFLECKILMWWNTCVLTVLVSHSQYV